MRCLALYDPPPVLLLCLYCAVRWCACVRLVLLAQQTAQQPTGRARRGRGAHARIDDVAVPAPPHRGGLEEALALGSSMYLRA
jgi:hypothetical protein